jgi:hypothetical protein
MASRITPTKVTRPKRPREKKPSHLDFIRSLPCCACLDNTSTEAAHLRLGDSKYAKTITGVGTKPHDLWTLPLCSKCHRIQHETHEGMFWTFRGINPFVTALALWAHTGDHEAGLQIIRNAR